MAEKLLKKKARKVVPKKAHIEESKDTVLVGTYKEKQLAWIKRHGIYNYPVKEGDKFDAKAFAAIKELWLYADVKGTRHAFEAEFVGKMTKAEFLAANPTYAKLGPSRSKAYYVFKTEPLEYGPRLENPVVVVRTADFGGRSQKVKKAIEQFKADDEFAPLEHYLPAELAHVPASQLRVCEAAVQSQYVQWTPVVGTSPVLDKIESIVMSIGEFGRTHSIPSHEAYAYLLKYKGIDYLDKYHTIGSCAPIESVVEDLSKVCYNNGGRIR